MDNPNPLDMMKIAQSVIRYPAANPAAGELSFVHHCRDSALAGALCGVCRGGLMGAKIPWAEVEPGLG